MQPLSGRNISRPNRSDSVQRAVRVAPHALLAWKRRVAVNASHAQRQPLRHRGFRVASFWDLHPSLARERSVLKSWITKAHHVRVKTPVVAASIYDYTHYNSLDVFEDSAASASVLSPGCFARYPTTASYPPTPPYTNADVVNVGFYAPFWAARRVVLRSNLVNRLKAGSTLWCFMGRTV